MSIAGLAVPIAVSLVFSGLVWIMWSWRRPSEEAEPQRRAYRKSAAWYVMLTIFPTSLGFFWLSMNGRAVGLPEPVVLPLQIGIWLGGANALLLLADRIPVVGDKALLAANELKTRFYGGWLTR